MKTNPVLIIKLTPLVCLSIALLALTSCSSSPKGKSDSAYIETHDGAAVVETFTTTATITAIDAPRHKVTLTARDGKSATVKAGPEVRNFDQLQIGDQVKVTIGEEVAVALRKDGAPPTAEASVAVFAAPKGAKPGVVMVDTVDVAAKIIALDAGRRTATFQFANGATKKLKLGKDADVTDVRPGDKVKVQVTEAIAILVEKP